MMNERAAWTTRTGFYLAATASAFGLGNLWRFPYIVGTQGGSAFILLYCGLAFVVGLPLLISELMLGKVSRSSAVAGLLDRNVVENFDNPKETRHLWVGRFWTITGLVLFSYYAIVSGWVLYFFMQFVSAPFKGDTFEASGLFGKLIDSKTLQIGLISVHVLIVTTILTKGVREGIERWVRVVMPLFFLLILYLMYKSLNLPGAEEALRFMFYPDLTKLTSSSLIEALGHVFFTLSIGIGAMIVFGSYLRKEVPVVKAGVIVALMDILVSLMAGLIVFPIAFSGSISIDAGQSLLFESMPLLFSRIGLGSVFGAAFFLCLYFASLVASFALLEASVAHMQDRYDFSRTSASRFMGIIGFVISSVPVLLGLMSSEEDILLFYDAIIIKILLPICALGLVFIIGYKFNARTKKEYFLTEEIPDTKVLYPVWSFIMKIGAPALIILSMVLSL